MRDPLAQQVRACLLSYLAHQSSLRDLWLWLQTNVVATEADRSNAEVLALAGALLLYLSEYSEGHRVESELRTLFLPLLTSYPVSSDSAPAVSASTSARATLHRSYSLAA
jgi:hypothetical protein